MPGLGAVLTFTLIALLPELGKMSRKQIAVLRLDSELNRRLGSGACASGRCREALFPPGPFRFLVTATDRAIMEA